MFYVSSTCILDIAFELLALDRAVQDNQIDLALLINASALMIHMVLLFILCFFSEKFTYRSYDVTDLIYGDLLWYKLPNKQQKLLILAICRAQKYFRLNGYGVFDCSLELFSKVIHGIFFMLVSLAGDKSDYFNMNCL